MGLDAEHRALVAGAALALLLAAPPPAAACDLALALAIDVSGSVDPQEYRLQMDGLAHALADPTVADALAASRAAVIVIQWSGRSRQAVVIPWTRIEEPAGALALAARVADVERRWWLFSTGIGEALIFAANSFAEVPDCRRRVIDVSGDGRSNEGVAPQDVRAVLAARGITINGLAIEGSEPDLTGYYRENVIAGPGAFVFTAHTFEDYPETIRRKLLTEVTDPVTRAPLSDPIPARCCP